MSYGSRKGLPCPRIYFSYDYTYQCANVFGDSRPPRVHPPLARNAAAGHNRFMRSWLLLLVVFGGIYGLLLLFLYFYQAHLIYFPSAHLWATPERLGMEFDDLELTIDRDIVHGWYVPADSGAPVVLFCHGNAGNIADRLEMIEDLHQSGLSVLIFDYRGYGRSTGTPDETGSYTAAEAAYQWLRNRGYHDSDIVIFGKSLGASVAAHVAQNQPLRALVLESPFSSMADVAAANYAWIPVRLLLKYDYETTDYVKQARTPVTVIHSPHDEIVPFELGRKVFESAPEPKRFIEASGGHNYYPPTPWVDILDLDTAQPETE